MNITFHNRAPVYLGNKPGLMFWASADDECIPCTISAEALKDHFGAASSREKDLINAFDKSRGLIEGAAEQLLRSVGRKPVVLRSGYFRFSECRGGKRVQPWEDRTKRSDEGAGRRLLHADTHADNHATDSRGAR